MKCIECKSLALKDYPAIAKTGFGQCKQDKLSGVFVSFAYNRQCEKFEPATPEIVAKRIAWQKKEK